MERRAGIACRLPLRTRTACSGRTSLAWRRAIPIASIVRASRRRLTENGYYVWDDSLLVSDDGGDAFSEPLRQSAALLGFALANDGETLLAGYGDPRTDPALSLREELGIYAAPMAPANELTFERIVADLDVSCLHATPSGLYVCATETDPLGVNPTLEADFHLGFHAGSSLPADRADFTPLLKLRDVRGPAPWRDAVSPCDAEWQRECAQLFACDNDPLELSDGALLCGEADGEGRGGGRRSGRGRRRRNGSGRRRRNGSERRRRRIRVRVSCRRRRSYPELRLGVRVSGHVVA